MKLFSEPYLIKGDAIANIPLLSLKKNPLNMRKIILILPMVILILTLRTK